MRRPVPELPELAEALSSRRLPISCECAHPPVLDAWQACSFLTSHVHDGALLRPYRHAEQMALPHAAALSCSHLPSSAHARRVVCSATVRDASSSLLDQNLTTEPIRSRADLRVMAFRSSGSRRRECQAEHLEDPAPLGHLPVADIGAAHPFVEAACIWLGLPFESVCLLALSPFDRTTERHRRLESAPVAGLRPFGQRLKMRLWHSVAQPRVADAWRTSRTLRHASAGDRCRTG